MSVDNSWPECVTSVRQFAGPTAQDAGAVDWSKVAQSDLDNGFKGDKPFPLICPGRHCTEGVNQSPAGHHFCNCQDINGNPIQNCTPKAALTPYATSVCLNIAGEDPEGKNYGVAGKNCFRLGNNYYELHCWCCCSCYANGTLILSPWGLKKIEDFQRGDKVMAASLTATSGRVGLQWNAAKVGFSFGTADGTQAGMVFLRYGANGSMICTPDQLFLLKDGKMKRGDRLVPGQDVLVDPNGGPVVLHSISLGTYHGGVHHIATKPGFTGDLQGHLLNSAGIVTGDFDLQIHAPQLKDKFLVSGHDELPVIGSKAYEEAYPSLTKTHIGTYDAGTGAEAAKPLMFFANELIREYVPPDAASYLTKAQADDIADTNRSVAFVKIQQSNLIAQNVVRTWSGHFPDIRFRVFVGHMEVNAYAFTLHGQSTVALTDGLTRLEGLDYEGMALIVAHLKNRLAKAAPTGENGWTSVAMSDYYAGADLQSVYVGQSLSAVMDEGPKQIKTVLFEHITSVNDRYEGDPYAPTTQSRSDAIAAGNAFQYPPPGIGGPEIGGLQVVGATVSEPHFNATSFVTRRISEADSQQVYNTLVEKGILDGDGNLTQHVTPKTDLSFLFPDADPETQTALMHWVRATLADGPHDVAIEFDLSMTTRPVLPEDFEFTPAADVVEVTRQSETVKIIHVKARLEIGQYTVKAKDVQSTNGSTLDPDHDSASITVK
jgi:hypothetical protein